MKKPLTRKQEKALFAKGKRSSRPAKVPLQRARTSKTSLTADYADLGSSNRCKNQADQLIEILDDWLQAERGRLARDALATEIEAVRKVAAKLQTDLAGLTERIQLAAEENRRRQRLP